MIPLLVGALIVVSAERDNYGSHEQQALVFREDKVEVSRNSNFVCAPAARVRLGEFTAPYDPALKAARDQATQMFLRLNQATPDAPGGHAPHGQHLFIGVREVTASKAYAFPTRKILEVPCKAEAFQPGDAVEISLEGEAGLRITQLGGSHKGQSTEQSLESARCTRHGKFNGAPVFECRVAGYGTALLASDSPPARLKGRLRPGKTARDR